MRLPPAQVGPGAPAPGAATSGWRDSEDWQVCCHAGGEPHICTLCRAPGMGSGSGDRCWSGATRPERSLLPSGPGIWPPARLQNSTALKKQTLSPLPPPRCTHCWVGAGHGGFGRGEGRGTGSGSAGGWGPGRRMSPFPMFWSSVCGARPRPNKAVSLSTCVSLDPRCSLQVPSVKPGLSPRATPASVPAELSH